MPSNNSAGIPAANVWGRDDEIDFVAPSGGRCRLRELDMSDIVALGLMDMADTLGMLVEEEHVQRVQGKRPADRAKKKPTKAQAAAAQQDKMMDMIKDPEKFKGIDRMLTKVVATCVLEPVLEDPYTWIDPEDPSKGDRKLERHERLDGAIYSDRVPFGDRMAIFEQVFRGMGELETFRSGSGKDVADVADESEPAGDAE